MVVLDALLVAGAAWMVMQVKTGTWNTPDPAATITEITRAAGGAIGIVTGVSLGAFLVRRRRGDRAIRPYANECEESRSPMHDAPSALLAL